MKLYDALKAFGLVSENGLCQTIREHAGNFDWLRYDAPRRPEFDRLFAVAEQFGRVQRQFAIDHHGWMSVTPAGVHVPDLLFSIEVDDPTFARFHPIDQSGVRSMVWRSPYTGLQLIGGRVRFDVPDPAAYTMNALTLSFGPRP